jgi:hypothetical protein
MNNPPRSHQTLKSAAAVCLAATLLSAVAADAEQREDDWKFSVNAYVWLPTVEGTSTFQLPGLDDPETEVDAGDILDSIDAVFLGGFAAGKGRWGIATDVIYLRLQNSKSGTSPLSFGDFEVPGELRLDSDLELTSLVMSAVGTYTAIQKPGHNLKVVAGARYLDMEQKLKLNLSGNIGDNALPPLSGKVSLEQDALNAIVGIRGQATLGSGNWFIPYYFDIGTGDSDFTWQATTGLGYSFGSFELIGAYRHLEWDFGSDNAIADVSFSGVEIGLRFRW